MESKKKTILQAVICVVLVSLIWGGYFVMSKRIRHQINVFDFNTEWIHQVDSVSIDGEELVLQGFAFQLYVDAKRGCYEIVLHDLETGDNVFPDIEYQERLDVNNYFMCNYDYKNSGYIARYNIDNTALLDKNYELLLRVVGKKDAYHTGVYIAEGECVYANPLQFCELDVQGTELEPIVEKGILRVYRPDYGMYVYQYNGGLYWIAERDYDFNADEDTYVQWHLETSQVENLPTFRLENGWYFDNLGFTFSEKELLDGDMGIYRVAKASLPLEYAIIKMNTGCHEGEWIWKQDFYPYYVFE